MPISRVAAGTCAIALLTSCGGAGQGSIPNSGTAAGGAPPAYTVASSQSVVNGTGSKAPAITVIEYNAFGLPASGGVTVAKDGAVWWESSVHGDMARMLGGKVSVVRGPIHSASLPGTVVAYNTMASLPTAACGKRWLRGNQTVRCSSLAQQ